MSSVPSTDPLSVVVVGASRGIGAAVATEYAQKGHHVIGTHRGSGVPEGVTGAVADVTSLEQLEAVVKQAVEANGRLDVLVVSSGITRDNLFLRMSEDDIRAVVDTNLIGPMLASKAALKPMLKQKSGSIVLISSVSAGIGVPGQTNYVASKAGLGGFARSFAREWASRGIRMNIVAPGPVATDMFDETPDEAKATMVAGVPMGRAGEPHEIAEVVYWVSQSTFMTGATVPVAGGIN
ncbi:SDR family oxidoreductase [Frondihabitans cladoniiphilus]|uniref:3-oxoacyl-ACP reductase FabG1 n=1 Tax=Frondihabitans cladoniiphilus TaxID=715785 RepID=A0ABP8VZ70_9MICO